NTVMASDGLTVTDSTDNPTATTALEAGTITVWANPTGGVANEIVIDANAGTIGGLTNTSFDPNNFTSGQAATEDQLKQVSDVASAGWNVTDADGNTANIGPNGQVSFEGDDNISVAQTGADQDGVIEVTLNRDLELDSVTAGDTVVDGHGVSVGDDVQLGDNGLIIAGGPSVTGNGIDAGNQTIVNVAPGEISATSTDAVNGSQLWQVRDIASAGWNLTTNADPSSVNNVGPGGTVDFSGDGNVLVSNDGTDISLELADSITLGDGDNAITINGNEGSVTTGDVTLNGDGVVIANGPSMTINGINAGGMRIANVASGLNGRQLDQITGDDLMNAVNVGDLQNVAGEIGKNVAAAKTEVESGNNIKVSERTGDDGQTIYTVETERDVDFDSIEVGSVNIDENNVDENGNTIITGVGNGEIAEGSTDAVNGGQLYDVAQKVEDINNSVDGGMNFGGDEGGEVNRKLGDTVTISGDENITTKTVSNGDGAGVQVTLNPNLNVESVTTGRTTVNNDGVTIAGGPSMTVDGIDAGGKTITNVAPGVNPTDAVNVGQIQEINQYFNNQIHNVHNRIDRVERNANAGIASALAASSVPQAWMAGRGMVAVGAATYEGESAVSIGVSRLSDNGRWIIQGKVTGDSRSNFGAGIGAGWHW
ncbi:autotransporter adhesin, partial [Alcanivorax xiamenensis]